MTVATVVMMAAVSGTPRHFVPKPFRTQAFRTPGVSNLDLNPNQTSGALLLFIFRRRAQIFSFKR